MWRVPPSTDLTRFVGPPLRESLESLVGDGAAAEIAMKHYRERFVETGMYENQVYGGVPEALSRLRDEGVALFVATSKPETYATRIVEHFHLAGFFDRVFGATLHGRRAAKTDLLRWALSESKVSAAASAIAARDRSTAQCGSPAI